MPGTTLSDAREYGEAEFKKYSCMSTWSEDRGQEVLRCGDAQGPRTCHVRYSSLPPTAGRPMGRGPRILVGLSPQVREPSHGIRALPVHRRHAVSQLG